MGCDAFGSRLHGLSIEACSADVVHSRRSSGRPLRRHHFVNPLDQTISRYRMLNSVLNLVEVRVPFFKLLLNESAGFRAIHPYTVVDLAQYRFACCTQTIHANQPEPTHPDLKRARLLNGVETLCAELERVAIARIKRPLKDRNRSRMRSRSR